MSEWQIIYDEKTDHFSAPSDVEVLLGWWEAWWPEKRWRQDVNYARSTAGRWTHGNATHWQPLPSPPQNSIRATSWVHVMRGGDCPSSDIGEVLCVGKKSCFVRFRDGLEYSYLLIDVRPAEPPHD